jgi:hypothetical protein
VNQFNTVSSLKRLIESYEHIPIRLQRLIFNCELMNDSESLTNYGIKEHCTLDLVVNSDWVIIFNQLFRHIVACSLNDTVRVLLNKLRVKIGRLPRRLRLLFEGCELSEGTPLSSYGVRCGNQLWSVTPECYVVQCLEFQAIRDSTNLLSREQGVNRLDIDDLTMASE